MSFEQALDDGDLDTARAILDERICRIPEDYGCPSAMGTSRRHTIAADATTTRSPPKSA
jgi:hypothetical protein